MKPAYLIIVAWLGGLLAGSFIVVQDEILALARYCGQSCEYIYPLLGSYSQYDAETIADLIVMTGVTLLAVCLLTVTWTRKSKPLQLENSPTREFTKPRKEQPDKWQDN